MTPPTTTEGEEADLLWLRESIGHITTTQEPLIRQALQENPAGVHALAATIAADTNVRSPIAVLIYGIKEGKHHTQPKTSTRTKKQRVTPPLDKAHKLFTGKLRDLDSTPWTPSERVEFAIDYALDHCGASGPDLLETETQLRLELHAPRWNPTPSEPKPPRDPARDTEHARAMEAAHRTEWVQINPVTKQPIDA